MPAQGYMLPLGHIEWWLHSYFKTNGKEALSCLKASPGAFFFRLTPTHLECLLAQRVCTILTNSYEPFHHSQFCVYFNCIFPDTLRQKFRIRAAWLSFESYWESKIYNMILLFLSAFPKPWKGAVTICCPYKSKNTNSCPFEITNAIIKGIQSSFVVWRFLPLLFIHRL